MQLPSRNEHATNALRRRLPGQNRRWLRKVSTISLCDRAGSQPARPLRISTTMATSRRQQQAALTTLAVAKILVSRNKDTQPRSICRLVQRLDPMIGSGSYIQAYPIRPHPMTGLGSQSNPYQSHKSGILGSRLVMFTALRAPRD